MAAHEDVRPTAGWFPDPWQHGTLRFWSGTAWTGWISDGSAVFADRPPLRRRLVESDIAHLAFVTEIFLPEARSQELISDRAAKELAVLAGGLYDEARGRQLVGATPPAAPGGAGSVVAPAPQQEPPAFARTGRPGGLAGPMPEEGRRGAVQPSPGLVEPREPGPAARWWGRTRSAVKSDLAVHGLAYLGVLLFFVGAFGLVVFAFGDVAPPMRPVAELVIAIAPFTAAALLLHRDAVVVGRALEVGGGLLLPIVMVTTLLDGFAVPPDQAGVPLVVTLTVGSAAITVGYALWSWRHRASALRYLVAPMSWFTVAMATLGLGRPIPAGEDVATPGSAQVAAIALAALVTLLAARARPAAYLAEPTLVSALTGIPLIGLMALLTWTAQDWPPPAVGTTGVLLLGALHLLRPRLSLAVIGIVGPVWTLVVGLALGVHLEPAFAATLVLVTYVVLVEVAGWGRWPPWAVAVPALGVAGSLLVTWDAPWWAVGAFSATAGWAVARRVRPFEVPWAPAAFDVAAAVLPLGALAAFGVARDVPTALVVGSGLALLVTVPAARPLLRRADDDTFWGAVSLLWLGAVVGAACAFVLSQGAVFDPASDGWLVTGTFAMLASAAAVGPAPRLARPWMVTALTAAAWLVACQTASAPDLLRGSVLATAGLALVAAAHTTAAAPDRDLRAQLGLAGHVLGLVAVGAGGTGWGLVVAIGLATLGWAVTAERDRNDRSPVGTVIARVGEPVRYLPPVVAAIGLPTTAALALDRAGVLALDDPWLVVVPAGTGMAYAALSRVRLGDRLEGTLAWGGFVAVLLAVSESTTRVTAAVSLAAVILSDVLVAERRRSLVMTWTAWVAIAPLTGVLLAELSSGFSALPVETRLSSVLVGVGGTLLLGGAVADLHGRPWAPRYLPAHARLMPPVAVGAVELLVGLEGAVLWVQGDAGGWLAIGAAGVLLGAGLLAQAGVLGGVAAVVGWYGAVRVATPELDVRPWVAVLVAGALLLASALLARRTGPAATWSRWDLWLLVAAAPVAATGLVQAGDGVFFTLTYVLVGVECGAAAAGLRKWPPIAVSLGILGALLVLTGATDAGDGWASLTLLAYSVACSALATRVSGASRRSLQVSGAVLAMLAWVAAMSWFAWSDAVAADVTTAGAGALALAAAALAQLGRVDVSWPKVWGTTGAVMTVIGVASAESMRNVVDVTEPSWWVGGGMALLTVALAVGAAPFAWGWLRDLAAVSAVATAVVVLQAWDLGPRGQVWMLVLLSVVSALGGLALPERSVAVLWRRPALELGCVTAAVAVGVATTQLPDRMLLVPSLAACSLQAAVLGFALRLLVPQLLSPLLACAAWVAFASEALDGNPQWYAVPIGLSLLVAVGLWRHQRVLEGADPAAPEIVALELVGIGFLVGSAFVQAITETVAYAVLAAALGVGVTVWGLVTRVRRRLAAGVVVVAGALVVFVGVPLVQLLPAWKGAWLWLLIGAIGVVALLAATLLEEGRQVVRRGVRTFAQLTKSWE